MEYKHTYRRICVICEKPFDCGRVNQVCCSPECTYQKRLQNCRERYARLRELKEEAAAEIPVRSAIESLAEVNARARAAGMSYGQYMVTMNAGRAANG